MRTGTAEVVGKLAAETALQSMELLQYLEPACFGILRTLAGSNGIPPLYCQHNGAAPVYSTHRLSYSPYHGVQSAEYTPILKHQELEKHSRIKKSTAQ